ncbi:MAG: PEGA domain-containing protein [Lachnospiraceae bacterium]|nr:PEGA domain-containing protein [Lachnospiraceae bacterium]
MISAVALLMLAVLTLTGCTSEASNIGVAKDKRENVVDTGFSVSTVGSYDSADTAVVLSTDASNKAVSLINMETGKQYTLYYDGTTYVKDKYEGPMTISQIKAGDVVDITFLKGKKKLASIQKSPKAWVFDGVSNYDLAGANRTASIGSQTYSLPAGVVVLSNGRRMGTEEVVSQDQVTISGIDHKIYSVNVDKGHGYLRLKNEQPLLGGWIEVGNRVIRQISEDMLLTVPEGSYQVVLDNNGIGCVKEITVERDKEVLLDVGDVKIAEDKTGIILFEVTPASAKISVDGKPIETGTAVELRYGIHQVVVEASGYDTLTRYIQVGSERAAITFTLEETRKANNGDSSVSGNYTERTPWQDTLDTISKNSVSKNDLPSMSQNALTTSNNNKVYVDSPKGVEVFLDGNYMGIAPVRFTKSPGRHEITLKKAGYKTKSYSIYLENNKRDETYSFSDLEKEGTSNSGNNSTSGGTTGEPPLPKGKVNFAVTTSDGAVPEITRALIDGKQEADISGEKELSYGTHVIYIEAKGYHNFSFSFEINAEEREPISCELIAITQQPDPSTSSGESTETPSDGTTETPSDGTTETSSGGTTGEPPLPPAEDSLTEEQVIINQESHPIRNFFSSLFKK